MGVGTGGAEGAAAPPTFGTGEQAIAFAPPKLPTQTNYNDNVITSSHQDIEQRHSIVPIIEELELPK